METEIRYKNKTCNQWELTIMFLNDCFPNLKLCTCEGVKVNNDYFKTHIIRLLNCRKDSTCIPIFRQYLKCRGCHVPGHTV